MQVRQCDNCHATLVEGKNNLVEGIFKSGNIQIKDGYETADVVLTIINSAGGMDRGDQIKKYKPDYCNTCLGALIGTGQMPKRVTTR